MLRLRRSAVVLLCAGAALLAGCELRGAAVAGRSAHAAFAPPHYALPMAVVHGGFSAQPGPAPGLPPQPPGPFLALRAPVAAAASGADVYIADAGYNALFHFNFHTQALSRIAAAGARPGVRLCALGDASVLLLDPARRQLRRITRDGREFARLPEAALPGGAAGLACDEADGQAWIADAGGARLFAVRIALGAVLPLPLHMPVPDAVGQVTALAAAPGVLYALEPARARVLQLDARGGVLRSFGEGVLRQPRAIAADRHGRVYVADAADGRMHVFRDARPIGAYAPQQFGAVEFTDLHAAGDVLAIADAPGARVHLFRLLPAAEAP